MTSERKVIWGEGTLISPQHFQQQERHYDAQISLYYLAQRAYGFGIQDLVFNLSGLKTGILAVERVSGFFKNGTYFNETLDSAPLLKIQITEPIENQYIYLVWSNFSGYQSNYDHLDESGSHSSRYITDAKELSDYTEPTLPKRMVMLAAPNLRLSLERDLTDDAMYMPILHISSMTSSGEIFINENFIPACINMQSHQRLRDYQSEMVGLLKQRSLALANILTNPTLTGTGDVRDFLMLQTINRYSAYMHHISTLPSIHPCDVFENWLKLYGDLTTFKPEKFNQNLPIYHHEDLKQSFDHLLRLLREVLSIVLEQRAIMIPLELRDDTTRVAITPDITLLNSCTFVLAVQASLPSDTLRQRIPTTIKISSVEKIRDLVSYHLPGIRVHALSTAPRELPYHAGYTYFELDKGSELWSDLNQSAGMAVHLAGEFPDLQMECWAIKAN